VNKEEIRNNVRIQTLIEDTNITDAQIDGLIVLAMTEIEVAFPWPFLETYVDISLEEGYGAIAMPSDYSYGAIIIDDDNDGRLEYLAPTTFFALFGNDTGNTGTNPLCFTIWKNEILLHPVPSADDGSRLTLYYYRNIIELETDGESPEYHTAFHWGLVEYCKWKLYEREEYYDQSERSRIIYASYLQDMVTYYQDRIKRAPWTAGDGYGRLFYGSRDNTPWIMEI
jgi:hypothetical protein